ncbi:MAG: molybdopterin synthase catalytic subunit [Candidatus Azotimanducaceae bacterium]|jgi:molybdopterin synthase catalytic subunit|tara:strand:- start:2165 stop:2623 length:459 start_codon:yes stop_codon:yes gene_type:complete
MYRSVLIQTEDFSLDAALAELKAQSGLAGGLCFFTGAVRDSNLDQAVGGLYLEHYPGMTERQLDRILDAAAQRWQLQGAIVVHRIGQLMPGDNIVLVAVAASHRGEAFEACEMIMDYLKTDATFWKKESIADGHRWIEARSSDKAKTTAWDA